jgi:hypothetical protein
MDRESTASRGRTGRVVLPRFTDAHGLLPLIHGQRQDVAEERFANSVALGPPIDAEAGNAKDRQRTGRQPLADPSAGEARSLEAAGSYRGEADSALIEHGHVCDREVEFESGARNSTLQRPDPDSSGVAGCRMKAVPRLSGLASRLQCVGRMSATTLLVLALWPATNSARPEPPAMNVTEPTTPAPPPPMVSAAPPPSQPPEAETHLRWYGWQTLVGVLGWSFVLQALPKDTASGTLNTVTAIGMVVAPIVIHIANGDPKKIGYYGLAVAGGAALSYLTLQLLGGSVGDSSDAAGAHHSEADLSFALVGGTVIAAMLDTAAFTWKRVPVTPTVAPLAGGGAALLVGGRF